MRDMSIEAQVEQFAAWLRTQRYGATAATDRDLQRRFKLRDIDGALRLVGAARDGGHVVVEGRDQHRRIYLADSKPGYFATPVPTDGRSTSAPKPSVAGKAATAIIIDEAAGFDKTIADNSTDPTSVLPTPVAAGPQRAPRWRNPRHPVTAPLLLEEFELLTALAKVRGIAVGRFAREIIVAHLSNTPAPFFDPAIADAARSEGADFWQLVRHLLTIGLREWEAGRGRAR